MYMLVGFAAGLLSTYSMDFFAIKMMRRRMFDLQGPQIVPPLLGRWILHFFLSRQLFVRDIRNLPAREIEVRFGFFMHYLIGAVLGAAFPLLIGEFSWPSPSQVFALGLAYGLVTNVLPWAFMYPSMGFGFCANKLPANDQILKFSFINHMVYGGTMGLLLALFKLLVTAN